MFISWISKTRFHSRESAVVNEKEARSNSETAKTLLVWQDFKQEENTNGCTHLAGKISTFFMNFT